MASTNILDEINVATKITMRPPSKFNVVLYNDDRTTFEFVILLLMTIFHKSLEDATLLTMIIHENGKGIAGTYSHEVATQKRDESIAAARANGYPLRCEISEA